MLTEKDWLLSPGSCPGFKGFKTKADRRSGAHRIWTEEIHVKLSKRYGLVNITELVSQVLERSEVSDGMIYIGAMHITAGIYINDAESGLLRDISRWIENLAPFGENYDHHQTGEDNGDAHLKSYLTNHQIMVPVTNGQFDFGTWQQIFYAEFDGMRDKRILVKVMGLAAE